MRRSIALLLAMATTAYALPPGEHGRGFRDGANHHLGDDSFVAVHGRAPTRSDDEHTRMHDHLVYVRDLLASRPATRPELASRRAELLGYLGDYIAAGITPKNTYVPWRSPVFIDASGNICAVGYLIERSVGRALPERIAREHRLAFLEDIAAAMPDVRAWVDASGFTLDELASIQPGYEGPAFSHDEGFAADKIEDGRFENDVDGVVTTGAFVHKKMTGAWKIVGHGKLRGKGTFHAGAGTWKSFYPDGRMLAEGSFENNRAHGAWHFFHASGRLAAEGHYTKGLRTGRWTFYYDDRAGTPISRGKFYKGTAYQTWEHYDRAGKLLATAGHSPHRDTSDHHNDALVLSVVPGKDGVRHEMHGGIPAENYRLDGYYVHQEHIYVREDGGIYDDGGHKLVHDAGAWTASDCHWIPAELHAARTADITSLHLLMLDGLRDEVCDDTAPIAAVRGKKIDAILASKTTVRAPAPAFVKTLAEGTTDYEAQDETNPTNPNDFTSVIANNMRWYMEWPHIDRLFITVQATLPGYHATWT
jgi:MORN repeat variant